MRPPSFFDLFDTFRGNSEALKAELDQQEKESRAALQQYEEACQERAQVEDERIEANRRASCYEEGLNAYRRREEELLAIIAEQKDSALERLAKDPIFMGLAIGKAMNEWDDFKRGRK